MVSEEEKGNELQGPNPRLDIGAAVAVDGVCWDRYDFDVFWDLFRFQGKGWEEQDGVQIWSHDVAGGGDCGGEYDAAPSQMVAQHRRSV